MLLVDVPFLGRVRPAWSSGSVNQIRIYDTALSATEIAALVSPVPEPSSMILTTAGLALAGLGARRFGRRQRTRDFRATSA